MSSFKYEGIQTAVQWSDLQAVTQHMFCLTAQNMSSDRFVFTGPFARAPLHWPLCTGPFAQGNLLGAMMYYRG